MGERCIVIDVPSSRARSAAPASSASEARSWPTSVTHPSTSPPAGYSVDDRPLAVEHLGARRGERARSSMSQPHVPMRAARPGVRSTPAATRSGWATVPASITVVTPLRDASTAPQRRRQLVVVERFVGAVQRHRPLEDRRAGRQQVGDAAAHERIAGQVLVGVDHAGRHDAAVASSTVASGNSRGAPRSSRPPRSPRHRRRSTRRRARRAARSW